MPYAAQFYAWMSRLTPAEIAAARAAISAKIDGGDIHTAGWMPGNDWTGTPFEPLFTKAARRNRAASGLCFRLLVWPVFAERPERWASGRFEMDGSPSRAAPTSACGNGCWQMGAPPSFLGQLDDSPCRNPRRSRARDLMPVNSEGRQANKDSAFRPFRRVEAFDRRNLSRLLTAAEHAGR
jgi:hypothetical protein